MNQQQKESYTEPVLIAHELLRDITGKSSGVKGQAEKVGTESPT